MQLCLKFAEEHRKNYGSPACGMVMARIRGQLFCRFWNILWIDANSEDNAGRGPLNMPLSADWQGDAYMVKRWLSNVSETWLVIFDSADGLDLESAP
jgi:hypothetical protein